MQIQVGDLPHSQEPVLRRGAAVRQLQSGAIRMTLVKEPVSGEMEIASRGHQRAVLDVILRRIRSGEDHGLLGGEQARDAGNLFSRTRKGLGSRTAGRATSPLYSLAGAHGSAGTGDSRNTTSISIARRCLPRISEAHEQFA